LLVTFIPFLELYPNKPASELSDIQIKLIQLISKFVISLLSSKTLERPSRLMLLVIGTSLMAQLDMCFADQSDLSPDQLKWRTGNRDTSQSEEALMIHKNLTDQN